MRQKTAGMLVLALQFANRTRRLFT